jgi:hypothetical protein
MPPYRNPALGASFYTKFVRAGSDLFVGESLYQRHKTIVEVDHLEGRIAELKAVNPEQVDAGILSVEPESIVVFETSDTLRLPVDGHKDEAREGTVAVLREQSPGRMVRGERAWITS